ncbi:MAG: rod shape-determining protein RodA [Verrucomicrobiota bacterium]
MNWALFLVMIALLIYGIYAIYSATWMRNENYWTLQIVWLLVSLPVYLAFSLLDYRWIRLGAVPLYVLGILSLVATMFFGAKRYGARSWLDLGVMNFQPSQLAILAGVMTLAVYLEASKKTLPIFRILACGALVGVPWILILIQPDLGSCIVWVPVLLAMMFVGGIPKRWLISLVIIGLAIIPLVVNFGLKPYQYSRITTFLNPDLDPQGDGWNINQSLIAIGSGGFSGKGFKALNTQNELGFLPATIVHNDFIFSVLGEQHGFLGGVILVGVLLLLFLIMLYVAIESNDDLGRLLVVGVVMLLFTHTFMNIGMTISVTPITGLPLPFISYGGSFLLITLFSMGIVQSVWIHRKVLQ